MNRIRHIDTLLLTATFAVMTLLISCGARHEELRLANQYLRQMVNLPRVCSASSAGDDHYYVYIGRAVVEQGGRISHDSTGLMGVAKPQLVGDTCPQCKHPLRNVHGRLISGSLIDDKGNEVDDYLSRWKAVTHSASWTPITIFCARCSNEFSLFPDWDEISMFFRNQRDSIASAQSVIRGYESFLNTLSICFYVDSLAFYGRVLQAHSIVSNGRRFPVDYSFATGCQDARGEWYHGIHWATLTFNRNWRRGDTSDIPYVYIEKDVVDEKHRVTKEGNIRLFRKLPPPSLLRASPALLTSKHSATSSEQPTFVPSRQIEIDQPVFTPHHVDLLANLSSPKTAKRDSMGPGRILSIDSLRYQIKKYAPQADTFYVRGEMRTYHWKIMRIIDAAYWCGFSTICLLPPNR